MLPSKSSLLFLRRSLGEASASDHVAWAVERLCEGADTPSLRILAGLSPRFDSEEVEQFFQKTCAELELTAPRVCGPVAETVALVRQAHRDGELSARTTIEVLARIYVSGHGDEGALWFWSCMREELALAGTGGEGGCYPPRALLPLDAAVQREWELYDRYLAARPPPQFTTFVMCEACRQVGEVAWRSRAWWKVLVSRAADAYPSCAACGGVRLRPMTDPVAREQYFTQLAKSDGMEGKYPKR